ncbi:MAG: TetR/AcrR family transcriptional regulator [Flavobacteriaceae bacterium]|nr:TetR/AcrR family transcriptional regulator [Flavobacteriaceae bacterium]
MAKKKKPSASSLIDLYMDFVLENNHKPKSVYAFSKANGFDESDFYGFFSSFESMEKQIFKVMFDASLETMTSSDDYNDYDARQKLLSFYYTFFANLTANRSFIMYLLAHGKPSLKNMAILSELKRAFGSYVDDLEIETIDTKQERIEKIKDRSIRESAWIQLLITMKFWMDDSSPSFEKTDIFIEKAVNTSFDLMDIKPINSLIDLGKFLLKEKMNMN